MRAFQAAAVLSAHDKEAASLKVDASAKIRVGAARLAQGAVSPESIMRITRGKS